MNIKKKGELISLNKYQIKYEKFGLFFLNLLLLLPIIPKIRIENGIYINPLEIFLIFYIIIAIFIFKKNIFTIHQIQMFFLNIFIIEVFFTILSWANIFEPIGMFKLIKYIIYIPVFYIGYKFVYEKHLVKIINIGIFAMFLNIVFFVYNLITKEFSIWNINLLSSGFVNRYFDFSSLSLKTIKSGAHAVWGDYCVFIFMLSLALFMDKKIQIKILFIVFLLTINNLLISVSRTSLLTMFLFLTMVSIYYLFIIKRIKKIFLWGGIIFIFFISYIYISYGDYFPAIQKILYTLSSFKSSGQESNISARLQIWILSLYSLFLHPETIILGSGYNKDLFLNKINEANIYFGYHKFPSVPESFYLESMMYGGIISLISLIIFSYLALKISFKSKSNLGRYFGLFFFVEIIANITSGSNMRSDLLMFNILLILGFITRIIQKDKK